MKITKAIVAENRRGAVMPRHFPGGFIRIEATVFNLAEQLSHGQYKGGMWELAETSNGGFFMYPSGDRSYAVHNPSSYNGPVQVTAEEFGLICCLYACSQLSFDSVEGTAENYHKLYDYVYQDDTPYNTSAIYEALD